MGVGCEEWGRWEGRICCVWFCFGVCKGGGILFLLRLMRDRGVRVSVWGCDGLNGEVGLFFGGVGGERGEGIWLGCMCNGSWYLMVLMVVL